MGAGLADAGAVGEAVGAGVAGSAGVGAAVAGAAGGDGTTAAGVPGCDGDVGIANDGAFDADVVGEVDPQPPTADANDRTTISAAKEWRRAPM